MVTQPWPIAGDRLHDQPPPREAQRHHSLLPNAAWRDVNRRDTAASAREDPFAARVHGVVARPA